ncbi:MAG: hypothetical protein ABJE95_23790 [Byssovorax sp.]
MSRATPTASLPLIGFPGARHCALAALVLAFSSAGCAGVGSEDASEDVDGESASITATQLTVNIKTYAGNYLVADKGGGADLMAYSTQAKEWETFTLTDLNGGSLVSGDVVTLKGTGGQWVSAAQGGGGKLTVTAPWQKGWEQLKIVKVGGSGTIKSGDKIALQTTVGGEYLSVINAGGSTVTATAPWIKEWETMTMIVAGSGGNGNGNGNGVTEYAPYFPSWTWDNGGTYPYSNLVDLRNKTGITGVTLAFVLAGSGCKVDGDISSHVADIKAFVGMGGKVKASFGGAAGTYIEYNCGDPDSLAGAIGAFVDKTGIKDLDFDIEQDGAYGLSSLRGKALKKLQDSKGIKVSFTLPAEPGGLAAGGKQVVQGALSAGVQISHVNLMTMDYGQFNGQPLGPVAISSINGTRGQLEQMIGGLTDAQAYAMIGATAMIGTNDTGEVFSLADAAQLAKFARDHKLGLVSFWSIDRDRQCSTGFNDCSTKNSGTFDYHNILKTSQQ